MKRKGKTEPKLRESTQKLQCLPLPGRSAIIEAFVREGPQVGLSLFSLLVLELYVFRGVRQVGEPGRAPHQCEFAGVLVALSQPSALLPALAGPPS